ncbi:MAG TPA: hypothetical protein QF353_00630, partial [Gammaproteobacteria bacterium]|nr:hypothetical protein [Gammaproteobacteria bacterium]
MKETIDYIYVDEGKLYVMMPVISGHTIGLDNTCKAGLELQKFFEHKEGLKAVRGYKKKFTVEMMLASNEKQRANIQNQLNDLNNYEEILTNIANKGSESRWFFDLF